jgi:hypothetical protein
MWNNMSSAKETLRLICRGEKLFSQEELREMEEETKGN